VRSLAVDQFAIELLVEKAGDSDRLRVERDPEEAVLERALPTVTPGDASAAASRGTIW